MYNVGAQTTATPGYPDLIDLTTPEPKPVLESDGMPLLSFHLLISPSFLPSLFPRLFIKACLYRS